MIGSFIIPLTLSLTTLSLSPLALATLDSSVIFVQDKPPLIQASSLFYLPGKYNLGSEVPHCPRVLLKQGLSSENFHDLPFKEIPPFPIVPNSVSCFIFHDTCQYLT